KADPGIYAPGYASHPGRVVHPDGSVSWKDAESAAEAFYHDCAAADARWAWSRLRRQSAAPRREACPLTGWPAARRISIYARDDRAIAPAWAERAARERLGVAPLALDGGHSPFLSRPAVLAALLHSAVKGE